jgi:hypothetical protein
MNYLRLVLLVSLASSVVARGQQQQPQPQPQQQQLDAPDKYAKEMEARGGQPLSEAIQNVVKAVYDSDQVIWDSSSIKVVQRGGDEVAVALVHVIGSSPVTDLGIERICSLLYGAFQFPSLIEKPRDRNPEVSLLLLESSRLRTNNLDLQAKISALRSHLVGLYQTKD